MANEQNPVVSLLLGLYAAPVGIFALYYNWVYAQEHGFVKWLFFGEVLATLKALIWPYFVFFQ